MELNLKNFNSAKDIPLHEQVDWKFGLISRSIIRQSENVFHIDETSGQWITAKVDLETMQNLMIGKLTPYDLKW